jgi:ParB family chromosome partitioning protein
MGLDALLPDRLEGEYFLCPLEEIQPSPHQPREQFADGAIEELAQSIREKGLIQPVVLRRLTPAAGYELIAGERRWRAAQKAGLMEIPAIVRDADEDEILELTLIENLQREDLNPVEEAQAFCLLVEGHGLSQEAVASRIGKSRAAVANSLRLLSLPPAALDAVRSGSITPGHARAILALDDDAERAALLREILQNGLSVRQAEKRARRKGSRRSAGPRLKDPNIRALEERLARNLGTKVSIEAGRKKGAGRLSIEYSNLDDLDRILSILESSGNR